MKIDFEHEFLDHILSRGYEYFINDTVSNVEINGNDVSAIVRGNQDYKVNLKIIDNFFAGGECTCPYYESNDYCKHMAAVLYYLNENKLWKPNGQYNLQDIVDKVNQKDLRKFLYNNLINNTVLFNRFRLEFINYFPKLSKKDYQRKIYQIIDMCSDRHGFIDYNNTLEYEHLMFDFIREARKFIDDKDYETALTIVTTILDSIPNTSIDDSDGTTSEVSEEAIEIILEILNEVNSKESFILKEILDYVFKEIKTNRLHNYCIDLNSIIECFIEDEFYLDDIKKALEKALDNFKDEIYFSNRENYVKYLLKIHELKGENDQKIKILEKYSYDSTILLEYIDEIIKSNNSELAIKTLNEKLDEKTRNSKIYAKKLAEIYLKNNMIDEYTDILYKIFYEFDKYDIDTYRKIKGLYSNKDWNIEKNKIINAIKNDMYYNEKLNQIFIEEKMYDELFSNICDNNMNHIKRYEQYLLPKYKKELLSIYKKCCLNDAEKSCSRSNYKAVASEINYMVKIDDNKEIVKSLLKEIDEKYLQNRPAMLDEFNKIIKNLNEYIN